MPLPHGKPEVGRVLTFGKVTSGYNKSQTIEMDNLKQKDSYFCHHFSQILGDISYYLTVNYSHTQITKLINHPHYHFEPRFQLSRSDQKAPIC